MVQIFARTRLRGTMDATCSGWAGFDYISHRSVRTENQTEQIFTLHHFFEDSVGHRIHVE